MIYMFLSNNPSSGDINSSNLSCYSKVVVVSKKSKKIFFFYFFFLLLFLIGKNRHGIGKKDGHFQLGMGPKFGP